MRVSGNQYREIYKQDSDFIFDFRVSNYTSNNFQVGLSGTGFYGLYFRTGIIYDWNNTMVGAFNGQPVEFQSSRKNGQAEYSINRIPVNREIANSSHFDKIVASMIDGGEADLIANFYGNVPSLTFQNVVSSSGISGEIFNHGSYPVRLFDMSSTQYTGDWTFNDFISGNAITTFSTTGPHTIISGETIDITLFTSIGENLYNVSVDSIVDIGGDSEEYSFASLALISGNNRINNTVQDFIYSVSYLSSPNYLNLYFDYTQNRTGDALVTRNGAFTGTYSGWLSAISGFCSGTLYNGSPATQNISYTLDSYNTAVVPFTQPSDITYSAYATGRYVYSYNYYNDLRNGLDVPLPTAFIPSGQYLTDLGGYWGNSLVSGENYSFWLDNSNYTQDRILTGVITVQSQSGRFVFNSDYYLATGLFKREETIGTNYTGQIYDGRFYRGIAYCYVPNDYSFNITGIIPSNGYTLTGAIDSTYNCLLYKDVPTYSGSGQYVFSGLVSGKILVKELAYYLKSGSFGFAEAITNNELKGIGALNHFIQQGAVNYYNDHLNPFSGISNYRSNLMAGLVGTSTDSYIATGKEVDFQSQGFVAHAAQLPNNQYVDYNVRYTAPFNGNRPIYQRVSEVEFTGRLPFPITGFIQRGDFRYYFTSGNKSGLFLEHSQNTLLLPTQATKTNINYIYNHQFNGDDTSLIAKKYINVSSPTGVSQTIDPPFTGILESGYFSQSIAITGEMTGIYPNFAKNMPDIWTVSVADEIEGPYQAINIPPFVDSASRYRMENIAIEGDSEKYVKVHYNAAAYTSISGGSDRGELSFTLNTSSGTQVIE